MRSIAVAASLFAITSASRAGDAIPPEVVQAVKQATVYIHVETPAWKKSGSGFVVTVDGEKVLVVTNHHVAVVRPAGGTSSKPPTVKVVFDSGTRSERLYPAEVVASDAERDLAVLKVAGVKDPPKPISYADSAPAAETMAVYPFGFPFGQVLSTGKGFPAVTVGKASVSSLRTGSDGELSAIQIDGNLNPGNSGGPAVDSKGRLVGVAVAVLKEGRGIGFLVPARDVARTMEGRIGGVRVTARTGADGKPAARVEAELIDPAGVFRRVTAYYVVVPPKGKWPDAAALDTSPVSQKVALKVEKGVAAAEFAVDRAEGEVVVQVVAERSPGDKPVATRVRGFSLDPATAAQLPSAEYGGKVPFIFGSIRNPMFKAAGPAGRVLIGLEAKFTRFGDRDIVRAVRPIYRVGGTVELGPLAGADLAGAVELRARDGYAVGGMSAKSDWWCHGFSLTYMKVRPDGTLDTADSYESEWVGWDGEMGTKRHTGDGAPAVGLVGKIVGRDTTALGLLFKGQEGFDPNAPSRPDQQVLNVPLGKGPFILGSVRNPLFKSVGPTGGVLIGLEARFAKFGTHEIVRAVRPIYRVGGKEALGDQIGGDLTGSVTLKARDGYAVGAISGKSDWWCHGFSLTFMKVKPGGTLDPNDAYESDWVGWDGSMSVTRVAGNGAPVVGLVGKIVGAETTALGLLFKGQESFDPAARPR